MKAQRYKKKLDNKIYILLSYLVIYIYYLITHGVGGIYELCITSRNFKILMYLSFIHIVIILCLLSKDILKKITAKLSHKE